MSLRFISSIVLVLLISSATNKKAYCLTGEKSDHQYLYAVYVIQKRDTLGKIAKQFSVSVKQIKTLNQMTSNIIYIGQHIKIPHRIKAEKPAQFNAIYAADLAHFAQKHGKRRPSKGMCLRGVRQAINKTIAEQSMLTTRKFPTLGNHATEFKRWAQANPMRLCKTLGLAESSFFTDFNSHKKGIVYLYDGGKCGFHKKYGHIEVLVEYTPHLRRACSDHCRSIQSYCQPDLILAPVTSCDWLNIANQS